MLGVPLINVLTRALSFDDSMKVSSRASSPVSSVNSECASSGKNTFESGADSTLLQKSAKANTTEITITRTSKQGEQSAQGQSRLLSGDENAGIDMPSDHGSLADGRTVPCEKTATSSVEVNLLASGQCSGPKNDTCQSGVLGAGLSEAPAVDRLALSSAQPEVYITQNRTAWIGSKGADLVELPLPTTYAEATNLALQYPKLATQILALPLSPPVRHPEVSEIIGVAGNPSRKDTPVLAPSNIIGTHQLPDASIFDRGKGNTGGALSDRPGEGHRAHTPTEPNWALAPDKTVHQDCKTGGQGSGNGTRDRPRMPPSGVKKNSVPVRREASPAGTSSLDTVASSKPWDIQDFINWKTAATVVPQQADRSSSAGAENMSTPNSLRYTAVEATANGRPLSAPRWSSMSPGGPRDVGLPVASTKTATVNRGDLQPLQAMHGSHQFPARSTGQATQDVLPWRMRQNTAVVDSTSDAGPGLAEVDALIAELQKTRGALAMNAAPETQRRRLSPRPSVSFGPIPTEHRQSLPVSLRIHASVEGSNTSHRSHQHTSTAHNVSPIHVQSRDRNSPGKQPEWLDMRPKAMLENATWCLDETGAWNMVISPPTNNGPQSLVLQAARRRDQVRAQSEPPPFDRMGEGEHAIQEQPFQYAQEPRFANPNLQPQANFQAQHPVRFPEGARQRIPDMFRQIRPRGSMPTLGEEASFANGDCATIISRSVQQAGPICGTHGTQRPEHIPQNPAVAPLISNSAGQPVPAASAPFALGQRRGLTRDVQDGRSGGMQLQPARARSLLAPKSSALTQACKIQMTSEPNIQR